MKKFAYADPPYLFRAEFYRAHHADWKIWDDPETHRALIDRLQAEYPDGWALSCAPDNLAILLPMCPPAAKIACWISLHPKFGGNRAAITRHWEPLIYCGGRTFAETGSRGADYVLTRHMPLAPGQPRYRVQREKVRNGEVFLGRKPMEFSRWMFDLLGAQRGDTLDDLFPGSGAVSAAWAERIGEPLSSDLTPLETLATAGASLGKMP